MGYIERLQYTDHDVSDTNKFSEFAQQVYVESLGIGSFIDPVMQPK
jgi:hypothetical protein